MQYQHRAYPIAELGNQGLLSYEVGDVSEYSDLKIGIEGIFRFNMHEDIEQGVIVCTEARQPFIRMERGLVDEEGELRAGAEREFLEFLEGKHEEYERGLKKIKNREGRLEKVRAMRGKGGKR